MGDNLPMAIGAILILALIISAFFAHPRCKYYESWSVVDGRGECVATSWPDRGE